MEAMKLAGCRNVVLRAMESVSTKERVDPRMIELRTKMLLKGNLGGSSGQSVRSELERNSSMLKKGAGPLPVAESGFVVGGDAAAELSIFAFAGHLPIEQGKYAAADVVGVAVRMEPKVDDVGLKVVLKVKLLARSKSMQQRKKTGSTSTCGKGAKKDKAAKLTFQKDQGAKLQISNFTMSIHKGEEL